MSLTIRLALLTFAIGFAVEGATEAYQFASYGYLHTGWIGLYYVGLATTCVGFYLMYRGRHEWNALHRDSVRRSHRFAWSALALFLGAMVAIALLALALGPSSTDRTPLILVALVGAGVALAFGNFFLGLVLLVRHLVSRWGLYLAWGAFTWSLGVAVLTGFVVGSEFPTLLSAFFTAPLSLFVAIAPLAFTMAPLFVAYGLFTVAYLDAERRVRAGSSTLMVSSEGSGGSAKIPMATSFSPPETPAQGPRSLSPGEGRVSEPVSDPQSSTLSLEGSGTGDTAFPDARAQGESVGSSGPSRT